MCLLCIRSNQAYFIADSYVICTGAWNTKCWDIPTITKKRYVYKHGIDGLLSVGDTQKKMEREVLSSLAKGPKARMVAREKIYLIFILKKA